jgi:tetratricopeptide (TPR) repeat protein
MKVKAQPRQVEQAKASRWPLLAAAAAALVVLFLAYGPALHGEFLFDDYALSYTLPTADSAALAMGVRPVLQFTYWLNSQLSGDDTFSYHVVNLLIHYIASGLIYLIVLRLVAWSGVAKPRRTVLAALAAFLFLLHPAQTEAVAYVAGRSESLSTMFALAAFAVFLYRRENCATWLLVLEVLALFGLALASKEQTMALPVLLLLTDFWWNPGFSFRGIAGNWRLYTAMAGGAAVGLAFFWRIIFGATTAGFALKDFTWYQYFFTQCRALFVYMRAFVLPVNLNADWDFPISRTIWDHGAIAGLIALIALAIAAWLLRRRFRLATYGFFAYLILMAPTSSILPIQDAIAERRLYFSMLGLLLIAVDLVNRIRIDRRQLAYAGAALVLVAAFATHARAAVWASPMALWQDTVQKSPNKVRVRFQLAFVYFARQDYPAAIEKFAEAARVGPPRADLLLDWGLSYAALHETDKALEKLSQAAALTPTAHIYSQIGQVNGAAKRWPEALDALNRAAAIDPNYALTYFYRGLVYYSTNQCGKAVQEYRRALALDPATPDGVTALRQATACAAGH